MPYQHIIFAEGSDDRHAIWHLLKRHSIPACLFDEQEDELVSQTIAVKSLGGYSTLKNNLLSEFNSSELLRAGIVVDANADPSRRWQSLRDLLRRGKVEGVPDAVDQEGWTGDVELETGEIITIGAWLMPDNQASGALEEFATLLVPGEDSLWRYVEACIDGLPEQRFKDTDAGKALVHTWLAWQDPPRLAIGEAISKSLFAHDARPAQAFVDWVRHLFGV